MKNALVSILLAAMCLSLAGCAGITTGGEFTRPVTLGGNVMENKYGKDYFANARVAIPERPPRFKAPRRVMSPREAFTASGEILPVKEALGRVLSSASVSCPPAVPIVVCGEHIDEQPLAMLEYYGVEKVSVVKV